MSTFRKTSLALIVCLALAINVPVASAVPRSKIEQARAVKAQIDQLDNRVERQAERYDEARAAHTRLLREKRQAAARLRKIEARKRIVEKHLDTRARSMYRSGPLGFVDVLFGSKSFEQFAATWDLLKKFNIEDAKAIVELKELRIKTKKARDEYAAKERAAEKNRLVMLSAYRQATADLAERKRKLRGIESEIAALDAAERRARAARAVSFVSSPSNDNFPPPTRAPRSEIISIARRYLGAPYQWAASGPNRFDCSGFTMFVYNQVGVSLPHSSRAQIGYGERISRSNLQPGDLVFFGSPIHHVGIYVGGGMMINAPHTGAVVRIEPLHSNYVGAARP